MLEQMSIETRKEKSNIRRNKISIQKRITEEMR
jgi:hypothetical protein